MSKILESVINEFHSRIANARTMVNMGISNDTAFYASKYLDSLKSKNGNDFLEDVLVTATGRQPKSIEKKHGADSEDGELEAKPTKGGFTAHISDDTPNSLMRHHTIPFIIFGEASKDGTELQWALLTSYRIFDESRYKRLLKRVGLAENSLSIDPSERYDMLNTLRDGWTKNLYERSNPLPFDTFTHLKAGEYSIWINPNFPKSSQRAKVLHKLRDSAELNELSADFIKEQKKYQEYFQTKLLSA